MRKLPSKQRLLDLKRAACRVFGSVFNPRALRTGNRVLLRRLSGSLLSQYYSGFGLSKRSLIRSLPGLRLADPDELERMQWVERRKRRGKGPPPKSKSKIESKPRRK